MPTRGLTHRQKFFVLEYLVDLDGKHAALRAGYSESCAEAQASTLLRRPEIATAIREAMDERARRTGITADRVIEEYARIAFADMRLFVDWDGEGARIKDAASLSDEAASALAAIADLPPLAGKRGKRGRRVTLTLFDKKRALDSLALILGLDVAKPRADADETV
jgi:phage terminase small subunit